jgi:molybdate transport repressor ModE-like protein
MDPSGSWHGVELRHLAALEAIANEGSFSAAGVRMGYSQSAVSGQIATLERLVGARLVTRLRGSRKVGLTAEGQLLLEHARVITARLSAARADLNNMRDGVAPVLRIGTFQSVSQTLLPIVFRRLLSEPSPVVTSLREDSTIENLVDLLLGGELDVAFVLLPVADERIETVEVLRDDWVIVVRQDHQLARLGRPLRPQDVSGLPLVTYERCRSQSFVEASLRAAGAHLRIVSRLADYRSVLPLVGAGMGCGLVPRLAVEADMDSSAHASLRLLPLEDHPPRLIAIAWNRERRLSDVVARFVKIAVDAGADRSSSQRPLRPVGDLRAR